MGQATGGTGSGVDAQGNLSGTVSGGNYSNPFLNMLQGLLGGGVQGLSQYGQQSQRGGYTPSPQGDQGPQAPLYSYYNRPGQNFYGG